MGTVDPAWAINEKKREEAIVGTLKSGWCITNHHHQCPKEYVNKAVPECVCPCHSAEKPDLDANGNPIDWSFL